MPIDRKLYHPNFPKRSKLCIKRARYTCQHCWARKGEEFIAKSGRTEKVTIQAHHPNRDPWNGRAVLIALCEQCHIDTDKWYRGTKVHLAAQRKRRQALISAGQLELPLPHIRKAARS
jgi:5-methylcytosine-specific restriction endonuclease McrA